MTGNQAPSIRNGSLDGGSIVISHKEYLGDIRSNATALAFNSTTFRINPGDEGTFPWLSQCARNFQQYRLEGLCFHFKSMSGDALNSVNTSLGAVMMCTQYDAQQAPPTTKSEMENMEFAQSVKPSTNCTHFVECAKNQSTLSELYINENRVNQQGDKRFYDFGNFTIGSVGNQGTATNLGELWVSYQIRLFKPQLWDALGRDVEVFNYVSDGVTDTHNNATPLGVLDWTKPELNPTYFYPGNTLKVTYKDPKQVVFESKGGTPKAFQITYTSSSTASTAVVMDFLSNLTFYQCQLMGSFLGDNTGTGITNFVMPPAGTTGKAQSLTFTVNMDERNPNNYWGFGWSADVVMAANPFYTNLTVLEIPYERN